MGQKSNIVVAVALTFCLSYLILNQLQFAEYVNHNNNNSNNAVKAPCNCSQTCKNSGKNSDNNHNAEEQSSSLSLKKRVSVGNNDNNAENKKKAAKEDEDGDGKEWKKGEKRKERRENREIVKNDDDHHDGNNNKDIIINNNNDNIGNVKVQKRKENNEGKVKGKELILVKPCPVISSLPGEIQYFGIRNKVLGESLFNDGAKEFIKSVSHRDYNCGDKVLAVVGSFYFWNMNGLDGSPQGDILQWSDIVTSLIALGFDVRVSRTADSLDSSYFAVITDYIGHHVLVDKEATLPIDQQHYRDFIKVHFDRVFIIDIFGTDEEGNKPRQLLFGGLGLPRLKQVLTFIPENNPKNSFIGIVINKPNCAASNEKKEWKALLWGKESSYLQSSPSGYLSSIAKKIPIYSTFKDVAIKGVVMSDGIVINNLGVLPQDEFHREMCKFAVFVGLGDPAQGPAAIEAVSRGAVVINPKKVPPIVWKIDEKPNSVPWTSQHPHLETVGPPCAYSVDPRNSMEIQIALDNAKTFIDQHRRDQCHDDVVYEFSAKSMIGRLYYALTSK